MTAKTLDGEKIGTQTRYYHPQATNEKNSKMLYGAQIKVANIRDTSIQPYQTKAESFEFVLPESIRTVDITVDLSYYLGNPDQRYELHRITRKVTLDR
ncbi:MAG: hypothetical protein MUO52_01970 [Desulfobacterales bacterium]|nr:hypothetical protein [Desulfobacterales bacterium]